MEGGWVGDAVSKRAKHVAEKELGVALHACHLLLDPSDGCIGLASLAVDGDGSAHIGVLVEDRWQRQGAGSALTGALVDRARDRQLPSLVADVLADDQFIVPLLARISPITTSFVYGGYRVRLVLERGLCPAPLPGMDPGHDKRAESLGLRMPTRP